MDLYKSVCNIFVAVLLISGTGWADVANEPVCYSKFDYDYKVVQKLAELETKQSALQEIINSQSSIIRTLENKLHDSLQSQWGTWSVWGDCFMDCSGNNSGRIQTRSRSKTSLQKESETETESRPCNAVQFAGCVKNYGPNDNYGITFDSADQVAVSICTAVYTESSGRYIYAVRRECSNQAVSCEEICKNAGLTCFNALHFHRRSPVLKMDQTGQQGLYMYRYNGCGGSFCGPNFCCCMK